MKKLFHKTKKEDILPNIDSSLNPELVVESSDPLVVQGPVNTSASVQEPDRELGHHDEGSHSNGDLPSTAAQRATLTFSPNFGFANWDVSISNDLYHLV